MFYTKNYCLVCLLGFVWFLETLSVILCFFLVVSFKGFSDIANKSSLSVTLSCTLPDRSLTGRPRGAGPLPGTLNVLLEGVGAPTGIVPPCFVRFDATVPLPKL